MKPDGTNSSNPGKQRTIRANEILRDLRTGMSAQDLMAKYRISWERLQRVFEKLVKSGLITRAELEQRAFSRTGNGDQMPAAAKSSARPKKGSEALASVFECPACGMPQDRECEECPHCGIIVDKYLKQQAQKRKTLERKIRSRRKRKWLAAGALVVIAALAIVWVWVSPGGKLPAMPDGAGESMFSWKSVKKTIWKAVTSEGTPERAQGDLYALVVGVAKYENSGIPALNTSDVDAEEFAKFLKGQNELFDHIDVKLLVNNEATLRNVKTYVHNDLLLAGKDDTVMVFFSGHGAADARWPGQFFFMTCDADPDALKSTAFEMTGLEFLDRLDAKRVLVIADACHSGSAGRYRSPTTTAIALKSIAEPLKHLIRQFQESRGKAIMTSCRYDQYSAEIPKRFHNSVFTHFLLEGLKGAADKDKDKVITLSEAYEYVYRLAKDVTKGVQHPQLEGSVEGPFPLALVKTGGRIPPGSNLQEQAKAEEVAPAVESEAPAQPIEEFGDRERPEPLQAQDRIPSCADILKKAMELRKRGKPWLSDFYMAVGDYSSSCEKEARGDKNFRIRIFCYRCVSREGRSTYQHFVSGAYQSKFPRRDPLIEWGGSLGCPCQ